jgi:phytoene dehydrogenase-like protein
MRQITLSLERLSEAAEHAKGISDCIHDLLDEHAENLRAQLQFDADDQQKAYQQYEADRRAVEAAHEAETERYNRGVQSAAGCVAELVYSLSMQARTRKLRPDVDKVMTEHNDVAATLKHAHRTVREACREAFEHCFRLQPAFLELYALQ